MCTRHLKIHSMSLLTLVLACSGSGKEQSPVGPGDSSTATTATTGSAGGSSSTSVAASATNSANTMGAASTDGAVSTDAAVSSSVTGSATAAVTTSVTSTDGGSAQNSSGGMGTGGQASTVGNTGAGGSGGGHTVDCELPVVATPEQAPPSGAAGELSVLNWAGYKAAVSYTFDDANSSQIASYDELNGLGVPFTFYLQTNKSDAASSTWAQAVSDGHELGNHSHSHPQSGSAADLDMATSFIETNFGVRPYTMAAPFGDASYQSLAQDRFFINRGVSNALIAPNDSTNPFDLPCYIPPTDASASAFDSQIDAAQEAGSWRVVLVHGFTGGADSAYQPVSLAEFVSSVNHTKALGDVWIDTVEAIGAYWIGQKLVSSATPMTADGQLTWSWTLPSNFPPGKCVRVSVEGGTLSQSGQTLAQDEHGYYAIGLDAGSVSLAP